MELWQEMVRDSVHTVDQVVEKFNIDRKDAEDLDEFFQARINPYYLSLIQYPGDPIWQQCVPAKIELKDFDAEEDPLHEDEMSPVPNITHRYPDRALFLVTSQCGIYCRFCTRKRKVGDYEKISMKGLESAFKYLEEHKEIRDVILSGGDPLMLTDTMLEKILKRLRQMKHIEIIRLGTRMPVVLPQRITQKLCNMLKKYHPIYCNTHFNHPWEITEESSRACELLANSGVPVGNQMVIMKGVNDDPSVVKELMQKLLKIRVRPYYMYMADETKGANHFRTSVETGLKIVESLRGHTSGLAIPHFVIDAPGGGGKIPIMPNYVLHRDEEQIILRNFQNKIYSYKNYADKNNPNGYNSKRKKRNGSKKPARKKVKVPVFEEA
ncbi:MAG: KamA family radical SAM protein [Ignavibacteria bacterium]|nr:KamA family radical SAM protein [Ignavibacteria bacterium]MBT8383412.1 KamA family radical SAM protein [Ignavibacteria bacterium]MBT8390243.1 KamA family radical SAM protein [Ignavibacteria bacterium]NNL20896.1 KamA family radical SAM protein [Ignavibacteriaceae bacterium]